MTGAAAGGARVAVVADDLIWATRLADAVRAGGGVPIRVRSAAALEPALAEADGAIVDLTSRAYDGLAALGSASKARLPVIAVGQHDDIELRRAARAAGAAKVYAYRVLFEHGERELGSWVASLTAGAGSGTDR